MGAIGSTRMELSSDHVRILQALNELADMDGARASELAEALGLRSMSVATTLAHLRDAGYVRRAPVRYSALWCLTAEGRRELQAELVVTG